MKQQGWIEPVIVEHKGGRRTYHHRSKKCNGEILESSENMCSARGAVRGAITMAIFAKVPVKLGKLYYEPHTLQVAQMKRTFTDYAKVLRIERAEK